MQPNPPNQGPNWPLIAAVTAVALMSIMVVVFVIFMLYFSNTLRQFGGEKLFNSGLFGTTNSGSGSTTDCSGVASVPAEYLPYVKKAADTWMRGDQAALIAVIQHESGWRPNAKNPTSSASGLGQFLTSTARGGGFPEFTGGDDKKGTVWPVGTVYDEPQSHPDDARFDAKRAISAAAHYLGRLMELPKNHGDIGLVYFNNYHGGGSYAVGSRPYEEGLKGRKDVERIYNALKGSGGCTSTTASTVPASELGAKIVSIAQKYVGTTTVPEPRDGEFENTFRCDTATRSCASFVSTVLVEAGVMQYGQHSKSTTGVWDYPKGDVVIARGGDLDLSKLQPGDVVWFGLGSRAKYQGALFNHVGIYIGNGEIIDTSSTQKQVLRRSINTHTGDNRFAAAKRFTQ